MLYSNPELHIKRCSRCHEWRDYSEFYYYIGTKDKRSYQCKRCTSERRNPKRPYGTVVIEPRLRSDGFIRCTKCKEYLPVDAFHKNKNDKNGVSHKCKLCVKQYHHDNSDHINAVTQDWQRKNPEKVRKYVNDYNKRTGHKHSKIGIEKRKGYLETSIVDLTLEQWEYALNYFHGCCAVCGRQLKDLLGTHTAAQDHWQPLSKGGNTTALNILPLCHGVGGCNNKKSNKLPEEWLITEFGKRKAKVILKRIQAYFESVSNR